jgi:hypothetical protein
LGTALNLEKRIQEGHPLRLIRGIVNATLPDFRATWPNGPFCQWRQTMTPHQQQKPSR